MSDNKNQAQLPLFIVIFEDGSNFIGGTSYFKTKWMEIPNKKIKRIFYKLPTNDCICLDGYEKYYHLVEATKDWMRIGGKKGIEKLDNEPRIEYAYIMGKRGDKVVSYRIVLFTKKTKTIIFSLKNNNQEKTQTCGLGSKFYKKDKWINAKNLKIGDEISIYNYNKKELEIFKITNKTITIQNDKYRIGDITKRTFDINNEKIKGLNPSNWK